MARQGLFLLALLIYALFSTPTPDHISLTEILVLAGILLAVNASGIMQAAGVCPDTGPLWLFPARLLLLFGFSVPLLVGLAQGYPVSLILRDLVPFLFLLLPLFLSASFMDRAPLSRLFPYILCVMGIVFVLRVIVAFFIPDGSQNFQIGYMPDPHNLVNAPTVLFAALFMTGLGGISLIKARSWKDMLIAFICFALTLILLVGMAGIGQRAHIGVWACGTLCGLGLLAWWRPLGLWRVGAMALLAGILFWPFASDLLTGLAQKNAVVGLNNRLEEAQVVWESFRGQPASLLLGHGWGATIISPAVGPDPVNYTHNLFTTYLLKGGLLGMALVALYLLTLGAGIWRILWVYPVGALAVAGPFLIDITLYASFKSLDFGLLLALIALWTRCPPQGR